MKFLKSIKFRLTIWYLVVIVVLLLAFGLIAYFMLAHNLYQNLDDSLKTRATELRATLAIEGGNAIFAAQPNETLLIYDTSGTLLQRLGPDVESNNIDRVVQQALGGQSTFFTATGTDGEEVRLYAVPFNPNPMTDVAIVVGRPTTEIMDVLGTFRNILEISGLVVIVLGCIGGWFLANRVLRPVNRITRTAQEIGETDLSRRIDVKTEDELGRLASTLNGMIERLEGAFDRQRQFTTDASHELRTPLAVVQAESTLVLSKERTEAEYRKSLELISQETAYMSTITNKLLFLARSDAGKEPLNIKEVNLKELLAEISPDVEVLVKEKGVQFRLGPLENVTVKGDLVKLRQLLLNILENAVRYTSSGGSISASVMRREKMAVVSINDTGIGISSEHLPHIFERFYRVDKARSRAEGGAGLGLAIAKYIAEAHGGKIEVESEVGRGSTFHVVLPLENSESVSHSTEGDDTGNYS